jgi:hypothetical protein
MAVLRNIGRWLLDDVWWVQLALNPLAALDLVDSRTGKPDHGKIWPAALLTAAIVAQFHNKPFTIAALMVLGSLAYGYGAWRTLLKSKAVTATEANTNTTTHTTNTTITLAPRDVERGVQPTVGRDWDGKP